MGRFSERELKAALQERNGAGVLTWGVWGAVVRAVERAMQGRQGIAILGLGRWGYNTDPVFVADNGFAQAHGLRCERGSKAGPCGSLNVIAVGAAVGVTTEVVREVLHLAICTIGAAAVAGRAVRLTFGKLGHLAVDAGALRFIFGPSYAVFRRSSTLPLLSPAPSTTQRRRLKRPASPLSKTKKIEAPETDSAAPSARAAASSARASARRGGASAREEQQASACRGGGGGQAENTASSRRGTAREGGVEAQEDRLALTGRSHKKPAHGTNLARSDNFGMTSSGPPPPQEGEDEELLADRDGYFRRYPTYNKDQGVSGAFSSAKRTARTLNLKHAFERFDEDLQEARVRNAVESAKIEGIQQLQQERALWRRKQRKEAQRDMFASLARQTEEQRRRAGVEKAQRHLADPDPACAFPTGKVHDFARETQAKQALCAALHAQEDDGRKRRTAALAAERDADASEIARFREQHDADRITRQLIDIRIRKQLASEWDRQIADSAKFKGVTHLGSLVQHQ